MGSIVVGHAGLWVSAPWTKVYAVGACMLWQLPELTLAYARVAKIKPNEAPAGAGAARAA